VERHARRKGLDRGHLRDRARPRLAEQGDDDDGNAAGSGEAITDEQAEELLALAAKVGADIPKFCRFFKVDAIASIPAKRFADAKAALRAKEGNR
jgi:hypothetical protein